MYEQNYWILTMMALEEDQTFTIVLIVVYHPCYIFCYVEYYFYTFASNGISKY